MKQLSSVVLGLGVVLIVAGVVGFVTPSLQQRGVDFLYPITSFWTPALLGLALVLVGIVLRKPSATASRPPAP
jgi:hypothetical protein